MSDHASIFYLSDPGGYLLCTDRELDDAPAPRVLNPFVYYHNLKDGQLPAFKAMGNAKDRKWIHVIYKPKKTEFLCRPDGYVDRCIEVSTDWIRQRMIAFDLAYPAGLPVTLLRQYKKPELDC